MSRPLLGVDHSVTGRSWRQRLDDAGEFEARTIVQSHGVDDVLARVLAGRDVRASDLPAYLEPKLRDLLPEPFVLTDMERAVERLAQAILRRERVAIFGDYDVDGACSAALLAGFLRRHDVSADIWIPDRIIEGYGPNIPAIRALAEAGATLLVTVDCGTASHEPFAEAARLGLDVVVLDHHQAPEQLPQTTALVNPNRQDDLSGLGHLCAAGVVFMALVALNRRLAEAGVGRIDLLDVLDIVSLATVADVVPLLGLNRAFVRQGLAVMSRRTRPGLAALIDVAALNGPPQAWHLGFLLGPRINAGGRIGDAALGAKLLLTDDPLAAAPIVAELDRLNRERQVVEQEALVMADQQAAAQLAADADAGAIVVADPSWHPGIVGLIAARLKERHRRPAFAFALQADGSGTGSGRSIPGIDLGRVVRDAVMAGLLVKGGGHAMAAGATIAAGGLDPFRAFAQNRLRDDVCERAARRDMSIDAVLSAGGLQPALVAELEKAGPFGAGQPEPLIALARHTITEAAIMGTSHVRGRVKAGDGSQVSFVAFRCADTDLGRFLLGARGSAVHLAGSLSLDRWGGRERVDLRVVDAAPAFG